MAQRGTRVYLSSGWLGRRSVRAVFPRSSQQAAGSLPPSGGAETESPADVNSLASGLVRSRLRRISGLVRRYGIDRRLPPPVRNLFMSAMRLRRDHAVRRALSLRPVQGGSARATDIGRLGSRRIVTVGELERPLAVAGHKTARHVVDALGAEGIDMFAVARRDDGVEFGLGLEDRERALAALSSSLAGPGVCLAWEDGRRSGLTVLSGAADDRHVRRARQWNIFTAYSWGDRAIGESAGTRLTFWEVGTSGQRELVGTRGQERFHVESPRIPVVIDGHEYPGIATFPVGRNFEEFNGDVDIVYTWVDGDDLAWRADFNTWAEHERHALLETAIDPARFRSRDELRYSLRSVWAYCGWARRIFIVTSGQVPAWLQEDDRVRVISHEAILPAQALPTFNSHAIEAALHRIDGLAEHFVYFNDDMFVGRPIRPELFFTPNGLARVFQSTARVHGFEFADSLAVETGAIRGRELLQARFGRVVSSKPLHSPYPLRRSVMERVETDFPDVVERTMHSRFRAPTDLSIAASFAQHYALALGAAVLGGVNTEYLHVESNRLEWELDCIALSDDVDTFCINETHDTNASTDCALAIPVKIPNRFT